MIKIYKYTNLSWKAISSEAFANKIPVKPPIVNNAKNPNTNKNGVVYLKLPPYRVARDWAFNHFRLS